MAMCESRRPLRKLRGQSLAVRCVFAIVVMLSADAWSEARPDPLVLIEGVYVAREQTPPSKIKLRERIRSPGAQHWQERLVEAYFEHDKYRVDQLHPPPTVRTLFDGEQVIQLDSNREITLRDRLEHSGVEPLYDARLLGIDWLDMWTSYLAAVPDFRRLGWECETVGREEVRGVAVWHVRVRAPPEYNCLTMDYWVEPERAFRVHRFSRSSDVPQRSLIESYYENAKYPWLPSRVECRIWFSHEAAEGAAEHRNLQVVEATTVRQFSPATWTIAGLNPPLNAPVGDYRLHQTVGYWDGKGLRDTPVWERRARGVGVFGLVVLALLVGAPPAALVWSRWHKAR